MNQTTDFDNLNPKSFFDTEFTTLLIEDRSTLQINLTSPDFLFIQKRERIDSEDFSLPHSFHALRDADPFVSDYPTARLPPTEEKPRRKRSSLANSPEPTLLQLEVR